MSRQTVDWICRPVLRAGATGQPWPGCLAVHRLNGGLDTRGSNDGEAAVFIVMIATECAPAAQAGGLGEVIFGLSRELELRGQRRRDHHSEVRLHALRPRSSGSRSPMRICGCPGTAGSVHCTVWFGWVHGRKCFFIDPHSPDHFFNRGHLYGSPDDVTRFTFFSKAALEFMWKADKRPEMIHCHDWQTAIVPVLLYEHLSAYRHARSACLLYHPQFRASRYRRRAGPVGDGPHSPSALLRLMTGSAITSITVRST